LCFKLFHKFFMDPTSEQLRGWIRDSSRHKAVSQKRRLLAFGCGAIYSPPADTLADLIRDLRPGDVIVVTSLARLANTRPAIAAAMAEIHKVGCAIMEVGKSDADVRNSLDCDQREAMIFDAVDELSGDRKALNPEAAAKHGSVGGKKRAANVVANRTPKSEAIVAWRDLQFTGREALGTPAMRGWSARSAYNELGKRNTAPGAVAGRRRNVKG
jgi:hypothetical protein